MGAVKNRLGSSIAYCQAQQQNFGPFKRLGNKHPMLRPYQNWLKWPILTIFKLKLLNFSCFFEKQPNKISVLDLVGPTERFSGIPTGRTQFYKILAFKTGKFDI